MSIYQHKRDRTSSKIYRRIYEQHYGKIPKDEDGRTYEIHHVDGNPNNNDPSNLVALTINEHYDVHYRQRDWAACRLIAITMGKTPKEISKLSIAANKKRVDNGTHNFLDKDKSRDREIEKVKNGTHIFLGDDHPMKVASRNGTHHFYGGEIQSQNSRRRVEDGTHQFLGGKIQRDTIAAGKNPLVGGKLQRELLESGNHPSQVLWTCDNCGKSGKGKGNFTRFHGDNCKKK